MSYHHHHHHNHQTDIQKARERTVWACAWCDPETYTPLQRGQEYTHGICAHHKQMLVKKTIRLFTNKKID